MKYKPPHTDNAFGQTPADVVQCTLPLQYLQFLQFLPFPPFPPFPIPPPIPYPCFHIPSPVSCPLTVLLLRLHPSHQSLSRHACADITDTPCGVRGNPATCQYASSEKRGQRSRDENRPAIFVAVHSSRQPHVRNTSFMFPFLLRDYMPIALKISIEQGYALGSWRGLLLCFVWITMNEVASYLVLVDTMYSALCPRKWKYVCVFLEAKNPQIKMLSLECNLSRSLYPGPSLVYPDCVRCEIAMILSHS